MKAIILAAGRGSRMKEQTEDRPKCLLELAGHPLLYWQLKALREAGTRDILIVRGYRADMLTPEALPWAGPFQTTDNPDWSTTNMLRTLLCADAFARAAFAEGARKVLVSYSDIVYHADHPRALAASTNDIAITCDELWELLWRLRFEDPLLDAETFQQRDGLLREIGGKPASLDDVQGQYMGLLAFTRAGWDTLYSTCMALGDRLNKTDMTSFLRGLLSQGVPIGAVPVRGRWCEADNAVDLAQYEAALHLENWSHNWQAPQPARIEEKS